MNRKARRAANKERPRGTRESVIHPAGGQQADVTDLLAEARRAFEQNDFFRAEDLCRRILVREPAHIQSLNLLGLVEQTAGRHQSAVRLFRKAIAADEFDAACHYNIANSYQALGLRAEAASHFQKTLALGITGGTVEQFIMQNPIIAAAVDRVWQKWPLPLKGEELFGTAGLAPMATDIFLRCALESMILKSAPLEMLLACARTQLLRLAEHVDPRRVDDDIVALCSALAQQCFNSEYILPHSDEEFQIAVRLRGALLERLDDPCGIPPLLLAVVAAYFPLYTLSEAERLLSMTWPEALVSLIRQQVSEPLEESRDRASILTATAIRDSVTLQVQRQYEENPYPRWSLHQISTLAINRIRRDAAAAGENPAEFEILIAGCGTGLQAVQVALRFPHSRVFAVDLSLTSLAYARRKMRELGLRNIEYAQADILELGTLGRTFDRIECAGVLHHLAEPKAGWRNLLSLLRPGGTMQVGLYSEAARQVIVAARAHIAERGYRATPADIRSCRQDMIRGDGERWSNLLASRDFYSISGCRDLLFNVMEHRFTIPEIATFLRENELSFLGFEFFDDLAPVEKFRQRFPDAALDSLDHWHTFELSNPKTFGSMYMFSVRKNTY